MEACGTCRGIHISSAEALVAKGMAFKPLMKLVVITDAT